MPLFSHFKKPFSLLGTFTLAASPLAGCGGESLETAFEKEVELGSTE